MADDNFYMKQALQEAKCAFEEDEIPVGAVIVCGDRIIARAHNLTERLSDVTAHAEMQAITAASEYLGGKYLNDCTLYVTVEPCVMCAGALGWSQIGRVVYGAEDEKRGFRRFAPQALHPKTELVSGVMEEECALLMKEFFQRKRFFQIYRCRNDAEKIVKAGITGSFQKSLLLFLGSGDKSSHAVPSFRIILPLQAVSRKRHSPEVRRYRLHFLP